MKHELTIPQVPEGTPKEQCFFFLKLQKAGAIGLALNLVKVEREESPEAFEGFWKEDLGITKGYVSKLRTIGNFALEHSFRYETLAGYPIENLYESIKGNRGANPEYVLAEAKTWRPSDYAAQRSEDCKNHEFVWKCKHCGLIQLDKVK